MLLAYVDPGAGSMVAQAIVAGIAGVAVVAKVWWRRLKFSNRRRQLEEPTVIE